MTRYEQLTESELDGLLMLAFFPNKKEKLNLSNREIFINTIMARIDINNLEVEYGESIIEMLKRTSKSFPKTLTPAWMAYIMALTDIRILKMAALMVFDENKEMIK